MKLAAPVLGAFASLLALGGCGGETGGAPSGIGGALTGARIRVSSFTLSTTSPYNDLVSVADSTIHPVSATGIDGALFPTRNSHSFRVLIKGAGSTREDVTYYFDSYDPDHAVKAPTDPMIAPGDYVSHTPTDKEPWDLVITAHEGIPEVALRRIYFAFRGASTNLVAVVKRPSDGKFLYDDSVQTEVPAGVTVYQAQHGAFSYSQPTYTPSVRTGRRSVIVQFFSSDADKDRTEYTETIPHASPPDTPASKETEFLTSSLTNSYVFTTDVSATKKEISLTGSFEANNGDNGLVDTGDLTLVAHNLPARWGSVKFEAFEENYGFGKPSIVFSKIVNLNDVQHAGAGTNPTFSQVVAKGVVAPEAVSAKGKESYDSATDVQNIPDPTLAPSNHSQDSLRGGFPFANRQRVLRVYVTVYELPDASGVVLAQTQQGADYAHDENNVYNDAAGLFPVQFISTPRAAADQFYPPATHTPPATGADEAFYRLQNLKVSAAATDEQGSVPDIAKDSQGRSILVTAQVDPAARFAYNSTPDSIPQAGRRTLSNLGIKFSIKPVTNDATYEYFPNAVTPPATGHPDPLVGPTNPSDADPGGVLTWPTTDATQFSQSTYNGKDKVTAIQFRSLYAPSSDPSQTFTTFLAKLLPTQGTGGGVIRGVGR